VGYAMLILICPFIWYKLKVSHIKNFEQKKKKLRQHYALPLGATATKRQHILVRQARARELASPSLSLLFLFPHASHPPPPLKHHQQQQHPKQQQQQQLTSKQQQQQQQQQQEKRQ